jgi:hypothetical protein
VGFNRISPRASSDRPIPFLSFRGALRAEESLFALV